MKVLIAFVATAAALVLAGCAAAEPPPPPPSPAPAQPATAVEAIPELQEQQLLMRALRDDVDSCERGSAAACTRAVPAVERIAADVKKIVAAQPDPARFRGVVLAADQVDSFGGGIEGACRADQQVCSSLRSFFSITFTSLQASLVTPL